MPPEKNIVRCVQKDSKLECSFIYQMIFLHAKPVFKPVRTNYRLIFEHVDFSGAEIVFRITLQTSWFAPHKKRDNSLWDSTHWKSFSTRHIRSKVNCRQKITFSLKVCQKSVWMKLQIKREISSIVEIGSYSASRMQWTRFFELFTLTKLYFHTRHINLNSRHFFVAAPLVLFTDHLVFLQITCTTDR